MKKAGQPAIRQSLIAFSPEGNLCFICPKGHLFRFGKAEPKGSEAPPGPFGPASLYRLLCPSLSKGLAALCPSGNERQYIEERLLARLPRCVVYWLRQLFLGFAKRRGFQIYMRSPKGRAHTLAPSGQRDPGRGLRYCPKGATTKGVPSICFQQYIRYIPKGWCFLSALWAYIASRYICPKGLRCLSPEGRRNDKGASCFAPLRGERRGAYIAIYAQRAESLRALAVRRGGLKAALWAPYQLPQRLSGFARIGNICPTG